MYNPFVALNLAHERAKKRSRQLTGQLPIKKKKKVYDEYMLRRLGQTMGKELKFLEFARASIALTTQNSATGGEIDPTTVNCLFCPQLGTGLENRNGRHCTIKSIHFKGILTGANQINLTALNPACSIFISLVLDKQTNGAQLNSEDVYTNSGGSSALGTLPFRDLEMSTRFTVLKEWHFVIQSPPVSYDGTNMEQAGWARHIDYYKKMNLKMLFSANTGNVTDIRDNSLHLIGWCNNTSLVPLLHYNFRTRFTG